MILFSKCMSCLIDQQERLIGHTKDEEKKTAFMKEVMLLIGNSGSEKNAPWLTADITKIREKYFGKDDKIAEMKQEFNQLLLQLEGELEQKICENEDPLKEAIRFARIGNYIDFSAVKNVTKEKFMEFFDDEKDQIDEEEYKHLKKDLENGSNMLYVLDNCGEIVLDKLLIRQLKKYYPELHITVMVRGEEALNDATIEDAEMVGLTEEVPIITNNSSIQGVVISKLTEEQKEVLDSADVILAKGQANFESLNGYGKNIYYLFLCKCDLFAKLFDVEPFHGMLVNENRVVC
ncbi:MAG: DUF89 family protein [Lachnospiraceae bacterium]|nr:DUF89 family protein [Lachnospiraceae bacterium]